MCAVFFILMEKESNVNVSSSSSNSESIESNSVSKSVNCPVFISNNHRGGDFGGSGSKILSSLGGGEGGQVGDCAGFRGEEKEVRIIFLIVCF